MSQINPAVILDRVLDRSLRFTEVSSHLAKRALDELAAKQGQEKQAMALVPGVLDVMRKHKLIAESTEKDASAMLNTHQGTLQLLNITLEKLASERKQKPRSLGNGVDEKTAGLNVPGGQDTPPATPPGEYNSLTDPVVGRQTTMKKASDIPFLRLIGKS